MPKYVLKKTGAGEGDKIDLPYTAKIIHVELEEYGVEAKRILRIWYLLETT